MPSNKVAVVILNWNGKALLEKFLPRVLECSGEAFIYVADNHSADDSVGFLRTHFPNVRIILNKGNYGFAKGYNEALRDVDAEYYVLLNSDVEVTPGWLDHPVSLMDSDGTIAACQPKILDQNHKDLFEYAGAAGGYIDSYGFPFCRGRIFDTIEKDEGQYNDITPIFWASGACLFIRASVYKTLGGFEEEFFAHMEEIDLCWRIRNLGYKVMYDSHSTVYHVGGGTLHKSNPKKTFLNFRNNLLMLYRNSGRRFWRILLPKLVLDGIAGLKYLASGQPRDFIAVIRAHFYFYRHFSNQVRKRRSLPLPGVSIPDIYRGSIVKDYFLGKKKKFTDLDWRS